MKRIYMDVLDETHALIHELARKEGKSGKKFLDDLLHNYACKKLKHLIPRNERRREK